MEFEQLPDIEMFIMRAGNLDEATEATRALMELDVGFCFSEGSETYNIVLDIFNYQKMMEVMVENIGDVLEEGMDGEE